MTKNCYNKYFGNFMLIGNWTVENSIFLKTFFYNLIPVNLVAVNQYNIFQTHQCFYGFFKMNKTIVNTKCKLASNVTIVVSLSLTLKNILKNLKISVWWNNKAYFLIVNPDFHNGCRSAREFLKIIWDFKILSALYFCIDVDGHVTIYNFNPYARVGTNFWKVVDDIDEENGSWTLLQFDDKKLLSDYKSVMKCDTFNFDKTRDLDQHSIRIGSASGIPVKLPKNPKPGFADYGYIDYKVFDVVLKRLNARGTMKNFKTFGFISKTGPTGFLKDIHLGTIDFVMRQMFVRDYWKQMTYPVDTNGVCIVARMYPISFAKIFMSIFTDQVWICLVGTAFISIITLKCTLNQSLLISLLEFLRIFFAMPSLRSPTSSRGKFFFVNILLLVFMINLYMQSRLSAIQTAPGYIRTIDSPHDLIGSNLPIYGESQHQALVYPSELRERFQVISDIHVCLKRLSHNEKLVCLVHSDILKAYNYLNGEIYKVQNNLFDRPISFTFIEDWPLASKVNSLLKYINEAGIFSYYRNEWMKSDEKTNSDVIDMKQMKFCFLVFYWGCILSICIFLAEPIVYNVKRTDYLTYKFSYFKKLWKCFTSCVNFFVKIFGWLFSYRQKN